LSIRVAVIGVGYLGQHHTRIYSELEEAELVGVVDIVKKRARSLAQQYGCGAFTDYRQVLGKVDALSIVTPTTSHYRIALDCLRAGKDLLVEKPITQNVKEAECLVRWAEKKGAILQVGHLERYNPALLAASEMIRKPVFIESERFSPFFGRGTDVDVTLDLMIHDIDIILSLIPGPVTGIRAVGGKVLTDKIDVAKAWLEFENGVSALATVSRLSPEKQRRLKVFQRESYISIDFLKSEITRHQRTDDRISSDILTPAQQEPLREELRDFLHCVEKRKKPRVSGTEGREALKVVLEISRIIKKMRQRR
jgi:predicted dehydrogenase